MFYFSSDVFTYKENELYCEEIPVSSLIAEYDTPLYIYSRKYMIDRYKEFTNAFAGVNHKIFYAVKSNFNLSVIKLFADLGAGVDVNSEGELIRALRTGISPDKIILTGVGKTEREIRAGLEENVLMIKAESAEEIDLINDIAGEMGKTAPVAIRVIPDIDPGTHPYVSTSANEGKFGIEAEKAKELYLKWKAYPNIRFTGIDMHIGSQIVKVSPFVEAVEKLAQLFLELKKGGLPLEHFDIGGGYGVTYKDEKPLQLKELADALLPLFAKLDCDIFFEPGRYLTANAGILATRIIYVKEKPDKMVYVVDAAMNDLLRPSIYGSYHHIQPVKRNDAAKLVTADIVGPVCETGDFLAKGREISESKRNDFLAVMSAGSYGMTMASNYNARLRAPEIIVDGAKHYVVRSRETYEHLLFDEKIVELT